MPPTQAQQSGSPGSQLDCVPAPAVLTAGTLGEDPHPLTSPSRSHMKFSQPSSGGASGMNSQSAPEARADTRARYLYGQEGVRLQWVGPHPAPWTPGPGLQGRYPAPAPESGLPSPTPAHTKSVEGAPAMCRAPRRPCVLLPLPQEPRAPADRDRPLTHSAVPSPPARRSSDGCGHRADRGHQCQGSQSSLDSCVRPPTAPAQPRACLGDTEDMGAAQGQTASVLPRAAKSPH